MKNIYFISDAHLGSLAIKHRRTQERRLVNFLDAIKDKAEAIYMLGDMFDFWFEYADVVPKGYTRFLGKISELTDRGVEVHFFQGNHDQWCGVSGPQLENRISVCMFQEPYAQETGTNDSSSPIHSFWPQMGKTQQDEARRRWRTSI